MKGFLKFLFILGLIALVIFVAYKLFINYYIDKEIPPEPVDLKDSPVTEIKIDEEILKSEIIIPNTTHKIKFENGSANFSTMGFENYATISPNYFLIEHNGIKNYFTELIINSGGSGNFKYLVHFLVQGNKLIYTSSVFIGDRVPIISIEKDESVLTGENSVILNNLGFFIKVNFLDRAEGDSFSAEPSIPKNLYLMVTDKILVSNSDLFLINFVSSQVITNPLFIKGYAKGTWFFEGSAPIFLTDWDGKIVGSGTINTKGDWMTENFVYFEGTIEYQKPNFGSNGLLILKQDNPSDLPDAKFLETNIFFE